MLVRSSASASAVIVEAAGRPGRELSAAELDRAASRGRAASASMLLFTNLDYNGGPVMPSNTNYTVYWAPEGAAAYPAGYTTGLNTYFEDLAHDSGKTTNVESVSAQYNDAEGHFAKYQSSFGERARRQTPVSAERLHGRRHLPDRCADPGTSSKNSSSKRNCRSTSNTSTSCSRPQESRAASKKPATCARRAARRRSSAPTTATSRWKAAQNS